MQASDSSLDPPSTKAPSSYAQILRSSFLIGGSSALGIVLSLVRNKATALMLGPAGFGLMSLYTAIMDVARSLAEMGINQSGVRQIAESAAKGGMERIATTAYVLRRTSVVLGIAGALGLFACAEQAAVLSFGDAERAGAVRLLAGAVFFKLVMDGQCALLQGLRRIGDLAMVQVLGNLFITITVIAFVYAVGEHGIVPALLVSGALGVVSAAWYVRRLRIPARALRLAATSKEASELLKLGLAFMVSAFVAMGAAYAVRAIVANGSGLHAAGLYQSAWVLGGLYVGIVLQAMGTDFYPRLVGVIDDVAQRNRLTNEQMTVSLVLAGPGILGTVALAPLALHLLYSGDFQEAAATLRWICVGMALRVVTWPPGYLIVSMNERWVFMATEIAWGLVNVALTLGLVQYVGLEGAGIAFAASYVLHGAVVYAIVRRRYGFRMDRGTFWASVLFLASIAAVLVGYYVLEDGLATFAGLVVTSVVTIVSIRAFVIMLPRERIPAPILRCLDALRLPTRKS